MTDRRLITRLENSTATPMPPGSGCALRFNAPSCPTWSPPGRAIVWGWRVNIYMELMLQRSHFGRFRMGCLSRWGNSELACIWWRPVDAVSTRRHLVASVSLVAVISRCIPEQHVTRRWSHTCS